jgi:hypothetical protein
MTAGSIELSHGSDAHKARFLDPVNAGEVMSV